MFTPDCVQCPAVAPLCDLECEDEMVCALTLQTCEKCPETYCTGVSAMALRDQAQFTHKSDNKAVIGGVVGGVLGMLSCAAVLYFVLFRPRQRKQRQMRERTQRLIRSVKNQDSLFPIDSHPPLRRRSPSRAQQPLSFGPTPTVPPKSQFRPTRYGKTGSGQFKQPFGLTEPRRPPPVPDAEPFTKRNKLQHQQREPLSMHKPLTPKPLRTSSNMSVAGSFSPQFDIHAPLYPNVHGSAVKDESFNSTDNTTLYPLRPDGEGNATPAGAPQLPKLQFNGDVESLKRLSHFSQNSVFKPVTPFVSEKSLSTQNDSSNYDSDKLPHGEPGNVFADPPEKSSSNSLASVSRQTHILPYHHDYEALLNRNSQAPAASTVQPTFLIQSDAGTMKPPSISRRQKRLPIADVLLPITPLEPSHGQSVDALTAAELQQKKPESAETEMFNTLQPQIEEALEVKQKSQSTTRNPIDSAYWAKELGNNAPMLPFNADDKQEMAFERVEQSLDRLINLLSNSNDSKYSRELLEHLHRLSSLSSELSSDIINEVTDASDTDGNPRTPSYYKKKTEELISSMEKLGQTARAQLELSKLSSSESSLGQTRPMSNPGQIPISPLRIKRPVPKES